MADYIGVGDLVVFLDVEASTLDQATASLAIASAQQTVRRYIDQRIDYVADDVVLFDGTGTRVLRLAERPVRGVTLVEEQDAAGTFETVTDHALDGNVLVRDEGAIWRRGKRNVRVTYSHGWNAPTLDSDTSDSDFDKTVDNLPADISLVTLNLARRIYDSTGADPSAASTGVRQQSIGGYSVTYATEALATVDLTKYERAVLDRYRF